MGRKSDQPSARASAAVSKPEDFVDHIEQFLADVEKVSGLRIVLHDLSYLTQGRLQPERYKHSCAYCQAAKELPDGERLCHQSDIVEAAAQARRLRAPFLRRCHAGISEAAVPIMRGDQLLALIFCGQAFQSKTDALRAIPASARRAVPIVGADHLMRVGRIVDVFFRTNHLAVESLTDLARASQFGPRKLMETVRWLEPQLFQSVSLAEAARHAGLSVSHFEHTFKRHMNVSFSEWRRRRRLRAARHLLVETDLKVREIAARVGYPDAAYFHRLFKRAEGMSPRQYRMAGRKLARNDRPQLASDGGAD